jgi:solute carrier family 50 protein (sugar transporter)
MLRVQRTVVKTRSVEYMPFSLSFFLFLNGSVWSVYSVLVKDYFIGVRVPQQIVSVTVYFFLFPEHLNLTTPYICMQIPNAIGFVLGTAQLVLYMAYRKATPAPAARKDDGEEEEEADEEEGLAHLMGPQVEMAQQRRVRLHKGLSLPTGAPLQQSSPRSNGFGSSSIIKSLSATPVELHSVMHQHGHGRFEPVKKHDGGSDSNE